MSSWSMSAKAQIVLAHIKEEGERVWDSIQFEILKPRKVLWNWIAYYWNSYHYIKWFHELHVMHTRQDIFIASSWQNNNAVTTIKQTRTLKHHITSEVFIALQTFRKWKWFCDFPDNGLLCDNLLNSMKGKYLIPSRIVCSCVGVVGQGQTGKSWQRQC